MGKGSKIGCKMVSHQLFKDKAKNRVDDLQGMFTDLQFGRKESRSIDVAVLEEQVHQMLREWKAELNEASPASSLPVDTPQQRGMRRRCLFFDVGAHKKNAVDESKSDSLNSLQSEGKCASDDKKNWFLSSPELVCQHSLHLNALARDLSSNGNAVQVMQDDLQEPALEIGEEFNQNSPAFTLFHLLLCRLENDGEGEACKRCNCKKSKCLKLLMPMNPIHTVLFVPNNLCQPVEDEITTQKDSCKSEAQKSMLESVLSLNDDSISSIHAEEPCSTVTPDITEAPVQIDIIREPFPPPVLADVHDLVPIASTQVADLTSEPEKLLQDELVRSESPLQLHISMNMMDSFMRLAMSNTDRNLETCGVLASSLKNRTFYILLPAQCQTTNEEEIFDVQNKQSLFPLGWIHDDVITANESDSSVAQGDLDHDAIGSL
ncbi:hypothetical protein AAC387_Pa01g1274 [Persea americana]